MCCAGSKHTVDGIVVFPGSHSGVSQATLSLSAARAVARAFVRGLKKVSWPPAHLAHR